MRGSGGRRGVCVESASGSAARPGPRPIRPRNPPAQPRCRSATGTASALSPGAEAPGSRPRDRARQLRPEARERVRERVRVRVSRRSLRDSAGAAAATFWDRVRAEEQGQEISGTRTEEKFSRMSGLMRARPARSRRRGRGASAGGPGRRGGTRPRPPGRCRWDSAGGGDRQHEPAIHHMTDGS